MASALGREAQKVRTQEQHLEQQRIALEAMRETALKQIGMAEAQAQIKIAQLAKMSSDFFAGLGAHFGTSVEQINALSFDYTQIQTCEAAKANCFCDSYNRPICYFIRRGSGQKDLPTCSAGTDNRDEEGGDLRLTLEKCGF